MYRTDKQFMKNPATASQRIYIGALPKTVVAADLEEKFGVHGKVLGLAMQTGFAFIQFDKEQEAHSAIQAEHGSMLHGRKIIVKQALDRSKGGNQQQQQQQQKFNPNQNQNKAFQPNQNQQMGGNKRGLLGDSPAKPSQRDEEMKEGDEPEGKEGNKQDQEDELEEQPPNRRDSSGGRQDGPGLGSRHDGPPPLGRHDGPPPLGRHDGPPPGGRHDGPPPGGRHDDSGGRHEGPSSGGRHDGPPYGGRHDGPPPGNRHDGPTGRFEPPPGRHDGPPPSRQDKMMRDDDPSQRFDEGSSRFDEAPPSRYDDPPPSRYDDPGRFDDRPSSRYDDAPKRGGGGGDGPRFDRGTGGGRKMRGRGRDGGRGGGGGGRFEPPPLMDSFREQPPPPFYGGGRGVEETFQPPPVYNAPPMDRPERNDCEIIVVSKALTEYAEYIEQRLKSLGLIVDLLFPNEDVPIGRVLANISSRGCLYAILVMPQNEEHRSLTLNILHGIPQEHRNMPTEDAMLLITRNFESYMRGEPAGPENSSGLAMSLADRHPMPMQMLLNLLAENRQITSGQYEKLLKYLQERRELQVKYELAEGIETTSEGSTSKQAELQNRIMNILNKSESAAAPPSNLTEPMDSTPATAAVTPSPLLKDPTVQKALDSLMLGDMFKTMGTA